MMANSTNDPYDDPYVVICEEIKDDNWDGGSNPPNFDFTSAKNHPGLINKIGGGRWKISDEEAKETIRIKLNDLDINIQSLDVTRRRLTTWILIMISTLTILITIFCISMNLKGDDQVITAITSTVISLILLLICVCMMTSRIFKDWSLNKAVQQVVKDHFTDWSEKGIDVKLKFKADEDRETRIRYLRISSIPSEGV